MPGFDDWNDYDFSMGYDTSWQPESFWDEGYYDWGADSPQYDPWAEQGWGLDQPQDWWNPDYITPQYDQWAEQGWGLDQPTDNWYDSDIVDTSSGDLPVWDQSDLGWGPAPGPWDIYPEETSGWNQYDRMPGERIGDNFPTLFDNFTRAGGEQFPEEMSGGVWGGMGTSPGGTAGGGARSIWDMMGGGRQAQGRGDEDRGLWGTGMTGKDIAALGSLGLGAGGFLSQLLAGSPKMDPMAKAKLQAEIDRIKAETERTLNPVFPPRAGGGGGGGGPIPPDPNLIAAQIAKLNAETSAIGAQRQRTLNPTGGVPNVQAFQDISGLGANQARFSALYDQVLKETNDLPKPNEAQLSARTDEIMMQESAAIETRYKQQEDAVLERANRDGTNPAGILAQMQQSKQQELAAIRVQARSRALAEMQTQQSMLLGRITPSMELMAQINPAAFASVLAQIFGMPANLEGEQGLSGGLM